jgi:hypothetical protein
MRPQLTDIVRQVTPLFDKIRITGNATLTRIEACDKDKILFIVATLKEPVAEFAGEFGIGSLSLLSGLLNFPTYKTEAAQLLVHRTDSPAGSYVSEFEFRDEAGAGTKFKTMNPRLVGDQAQIATIPWNVEIVPTKAKIAELEKLAHLLSEVDKGFGVAIRNETLFLTIGTDTAGTHTSTVAFVENVQTDYKEERIFFNTGHFLGVLKNAGSVPPIVRFSSKGVVGITVETEVGIYNYYLRAKQI